MRLNRSALAHLPGYVARPSYDIEALGVGLVHLGVGAFQRAHQAVFTEDAILAEGGAWGIFGASLRRPDIPMLLEPQQQLYTVEYRDAAPAYRVVGVLRDVVCAATSGKTVLDALSAPNVHAVTLTITEKGYGLDTAGRLDLTNSETLHDLQSATLPLTAVGWLATGFEQRRLRGAGPITVISCDNVSRNGQKLGQAMFDFIEQSNPRLGNWVQDNVRFPNSVVDCLVPASDGATFARAETALGFVDLACVQRERYAQWVLEDNFAGPRPCWEAAGAEIVPDTQPYERLKLHILNACHSALAYLGLLQGLSYVREAIANQTLAAYLEAMVNLEIAPALSGLPVASYWQSTKQRFANPAIDHSLSQIAQDGSTKLAQRILPLLVANARTGAPTGHLAGIVLAWLKLAERAISDPYAETLQSWAAARGRIEDLLDMPGLFPDAFRTEAAVRATLAQPKQAWRDADGL